MSVLRKNSRYITLHTESQFYLPGDEVVGTVTYNPKKQVSLRFVKIIFGGEENCVWIDKVAARVGGPVVASRVPLFRKETALLADRTRVEAGPHTWQFRFTIPRAIPPTCNYNGKATVSYWLKTKAATTFGHFSARFRLPVVIGQFWVPSIPSPVQTSHTTMGGAIELAARCSHAVAKCDDIITVDIHINNTSFRNVAGVRIKIKQVWECTGIFYNKNVVLKYFTKEGFPHARGEKDTSVQLKIPNRLNLCPTVTNASLFKCTYYIGVYGLAKMAGIVATESVKCRIPLTITNQPSSGDISLGVPRPSILSPSYDSNSSDEEELDSHRSRNPLRASESAIRNDPQSLAVRGRSSADDTFMRFQSNVSVNSQGTYFTEEEFSGLTNLFSGDGVEEVNGPAKEKAKCEQHADENECKKASHDAPVTNECIVCYDGLKNMLLLPCAHIATCVNCTSHIMHSNKLCPVCRTKISQVMRIYPV